MWFLSWEKEQTAAFTIRPLCNPAWVNKSLRSLGPCYQSGTLISIVFLTAIDLWVGGSSDCECLNRLPTLMMQAAIILNHGCRYRMLFVTPLLLASVSLCSHDKYVYGVVYACLTAALEHSDYHACHAPKQTSCTHTQLLYVHTLHVCIMTSSAQQCSLPTSHTTLPGWMGCHADLQDLHTDIWHYCHYLLRLYMQRVECWVSNTCCMATIFLQIATFAHSFQEPSSFGWL